MNLPDLSEIQKIRKKLGLSQSELARKSGVSQSLIARMEAGRIDPGYTKVLAIFRVLDALHRMETPVSEIMSAKVHGVSKSETLESAAAKMKKYNVSQMPVFENRKIVGSLSESTVLNQIASGAEIRDLSRRKISSCMEDPLPTVNQNTPITAVSPLLESSSAVIVVEKGRVTGIVTKADLLKMLHR